MHYRSLFSSSIFKAIFILIHKRIDSFMRNFKRIKLHFCQFIKESCFSQTIDNNLRQMEGEEGRMSSTPNLLWMPFSHISGRFSLIVSSFEWEIREKQHFEQLHVIAFISTNIEFLWKVIASCSPSLNLWVFKLAENFAKENVDREKKL